jgi:hypothetical protein
MALEAGGSVEAGAQGPTQAGADSVTIQKLQVRWASLLVARGQRAQEPVAAMLVTLQREQSPLWKNWFHT